MYDYWPLIRIACLANVWRAVRFLLRKWVYLHVVILRPVEKKRTLAVVRMRSLLNYGEYCCSEASAREQSWVLVLLNRPLLTYCCTMLCSSRQVICTSGSIEFPDKSYNGFVVSVESLASFDKFKLYPYIINNKIENLRTICNQK
jgi:hypothetical protein